MFPERCAMFPEKFAMFLDLFFTFLAAPSPTHREVEKVDKKVVFTVDL
jgi:hypothetical protein